MKEESKDLLVKGLSDLNIDINANQIESFNIYLNELLKWNSKYNLTAITDEKNIIIKHFLDSAIISVKNPCTCGNMVDIGSGAGFPGLVLKILKPEIFLTSVDANEKKIFFQKNLFRKLNQNNITFIANRVDDSSFIEEFKNSFDCAVIRAFSKISEILTLSYPIVKKNGLISIYKGKNYKIDLDELNENEIKDRFKLLKVDSYKLPFINREHNILVFKKK